MFQQSDATIRGCNAIARTAIGEYRSIVEAAVAISQDISTSLPDTAAAAEYQDHYEHWVEIHEGIGPLLG